MKKFIVILIAVLLSGCYAKVEPAVKQAPKQEYKVVYKSGEQQYTYKFYTSYEVGLCAITSYKNKVLYVYRIGETEVLRYIVRSIDDIKIISYSENFKEVKVL